MIGGSDLCNIVHPLRPKLHLHVALRAVIKERNMQGAVAVRVHMRDIIAVIRAHRIRKQWGVALLHTSGGLRRKPALLQKSLKHIGGLIQISDLLPLSVVWILKMALRHGDDNPVRDQIPEAVQAFLQFRHRRIRSVLRIVVIDVLHHITVELRLRTDQRLDPPFECKGQIRIFPRHIFIEFPDLLRLRRQEIIVLKQFHNLRQKFTVPDIHFIPGLRCGLPQVFGVFFQNF